MSHVFMQRFSTRRTLAIISRRCYSTKDSTTHFGYKEVPIVEKENLVKGVFSSVASSYDVMNDAMSFGIHRLWKDDFVSTLDPGNDIVGVKTKCIDVAGGTGDIALRILDWAREKHADRDLSVDVVDINPDMLEEGRRRFRQTITTNILPGRQCTRPGEGQFPSNTYDLYTIAFGIRNCTSVPDVLSEAYRVLKPGGTFACLEFSRVSNPLLAQAYDTYSFSIIPLLGSIIASDRASYQYLVESIRRFPPQEEFSNMIKAAGFQISRKGGWRDLWGGIACVHTGVKV
ncbi:hypothetical protein Clacol_007582 [Clathrus columnatus]|uniref:2-methoxy-6-polyprenyl-1,4-benzoquinol methylase, mitochondrial n=1 Tax=Clathrus columnatus TaxID=1419009 RepID=A0AAV5AN33_9AGAM|nr:hypothetical protein Clacol_007582 [Clathrus columnatus]